MHASLLGPFRHASLFRDPAPPRRRASLLVPNPNARLPFWSPFFPPGKRGGSNRLDAPPFPPPSKTHAPLFDTGFHHGPTPPFLAPGCIMDPRLPFSHRTSSWTHASLFGTMDPRLPFWHGGTPPFVALDLFPLNNANSPMPF